MADGTQRIELLFAKRFDVDVWLRGGCCGEEPDRGMAEWDQAEYGEFKGAANP